MLSSRSRAARVDWYLRSSMYVLYAAVPLAVGGALGGELAAHDTELGALALVSAGLATAQAIAGAMLLSAAIDHHLGRRPRPTRLIIVVVALSVLTIASGWPAYADNDADYAFVVVVVMTSFLAAITPIVSMTTVVSATLIGWLLAAGPAILRDWHEFFPQLGLFLVVAVAIFTCRTTVWMLDMVWQLDDAQHVKANLAVAEERLRFARDLHDVAGRALSVVALKAELAAKLGERGRPEAVEEMLEVRRIAQDSLAELRAVVSGLRTAQLDEELAGARSCSPRPASPAG